MAAEGALIRASEEPHRVEMNLTNTLAAAYMNYKNNLEALEYYRRYILPDQVRAYRGAYDRRQIDPNASFGDVVSAQQTLAADVTTYLQTLGQVWTSVTSVADLIQTDDLFEYARPQAVPALPDLEQLPPLPCCHPYALAAWLREQPLPPALAAHSPHRSPSRRLNPSSVQFQMLRQCRPAAREVEKANHGPIDIYLHRIGRFQRSDFRPSQWPSAPGRARSSESQAWPVRRSPIRCPACPARRTSRTRCSSRPPRRRRMGALTWNALTSRKTRSWTPPACRSPAGSSTWKWTSWGLMS